MTHDGGIDLRPTGRVSVWELAEFAFCPRAGWIARRAGHTGDTFVEDDASYGSLGFLPDYDADVLREALRRTAGQVVFSVGLAAVLGVVLWVLHDLAWAGFLWTGVGLLLPLIAWWVLMLRRCWQVWWFLRQTVGRAAARELPDPLDQWVEWDWWDFHRAGFRVEKPRAAYVDRTLGLDGRPWRLLARGSLRIPVFRKHKGGPSAGPSQFTALAAYSHLIEKEEGAESPFGVVLFPKTWTVRVFPKGYKVPPTPVAVAAYRRLLAADPPAGPEEASAVCFGCPHGQPRELVTDRPTAWTLDDGHYARDDRDFSPVVPPSIHVIDGRSVRPVPAAANNGSRYHSLCGDLFAWVPPHDGARRLALTLIEPPKPAPPPPAQPAPQVVTPIQVVAEFHFPAAVGVPSVAASAPRVIEAVSDPAPLPAPPPGTVHPRADRRDDDTGGAAVR